MRRKGKNMTNRQQDIALELLSRIAQEHRLTQGTMTQITGLLADIQGAYNPEIPGGYQHMHDPTDCAFAFCQTGKFAREEGADR